MDASDVLNIPYCCRCSNNSGGSQDEHFVSKIFSGGRQPIFHFSGKFPSVFKNIFKIFFGQENETQKMSVQL